MEQAAHLTGVRRQIVAAVSLAWLPLLVLGSVAELRSGQLEPVIRNLSVHVRLLIATPVFLVLDHMFSRSCRAALSELVVESFVPPDAERRFERLVRITTRVADSAVPEVVLGAAAAATGLLATFGIVPLGGLARSAPATAAQLWYALVGWPVFQFLLWRSLWRWAVWAAILVGLSRLRLVLVPTHPDRRGGLSFLSQPSIGYCALLLFALSSVLCAEWGSRLTFESLKSFEPLVLAFAVAGTLIAFGPLLLFVPQLERARLAGLTRCGGAATEYGRRFERHGLRPGDAAPSEDGSPVGLALAGDVFRKSVDPMLPILFDARGVVVLLVATLLPVLPVMLVHVPREDWSILLNVVTGGRIQ